jgi:hypothetical protein
MVSIVANYRKKAIMALSILTVLSQLAILPAFSESNKMSFYSEFLGTVINATPLPPFKNDKLLSVLLQTEGSIVYCNIEPLYRASVTISEKMTVHLPEGDGLSVGSFIVTVKGSGEIYVSFTAKVSAEVSGMFNFEGKYRIVKGTGIFEKVRGYGTIEGSASHDGTSDTFEGYTVFGNVEGCIWGLPQIP